ncbi:hypothetical protein CRUP_033315 [Coryphaenoides rupestris]|nr:hypothetical protein CRUP_033315 [Coryphaenoides rupestris]
MLSLSLSLSFMYTRPPLWPNEILEPVVVSVGLPLVLTCDPPPGPPKPETYWMSSCSFARPFSWPIQTAFPTMQPVRQDRRVSTGVNGDLYFANVLFNDSQTDYCCNARLPHKNSIQQKRPVVVKVITTRTVSEAAPSTWRGRRRTSPGPRDGERLTVKPGMRIKNFNKMIHIAKASFDDIGEYKPVDLVLAPEEDGRLVCRSDGIPRPTIHWFLNGESLETAIPHASRHVSGDTLSFRSVTMENTGVYQCNASNEFGYLMANAFEDHLKVVEGSRTLLECRYFGSPVPDLRWSKYGQGNLEGGRYRTHSNGTLEIKQTRVEDTGTYLCIVTNIAGRDESQIKIEPTLFVSKPQNLKVIRGSDVTFECAVKSDLSTPVTTTWLKNKKPLTLNWRISLVESNLVITSVNSADDGDYTCSIKTEMDEKSASARLMVMDRPNPPTDLQLSDPYERTVRLSWVPGDNNHSPVTEYLVQYDEDDWLPGKWRNLSTYPGTLNSVILQLNPYTYYEFRVVAVNGIGPSRPSRVSARLQTGGAPPDVIPRNIRGVGTWRNNMEISWEPLTYREWNGPHLKYLVWWKRKDSREEWKNATTKWLRYYIYDADTFTPYEIKVQAANDFGLGPESPVIIGYSGEDRESLTAPLNLRVSDIESTQVTVHWDPLKWLSVSRAMKSKAIPTVDPDYSGVLDGLFPYSNYKMHIVVANNRFDGPPSNTIQFSTPEGVPSVPKSFRIQQRHLDTIYVDWDLPAEPNGIITGYTLQYQTGKQLPSLCWMNATRGEELRVEELYPNVSSFSVRRYDRYTRYRFSLAAKTQVGVGEWHTEESLHYTTESRCPRGAGLPQEGGATRRAGRGGRGVLETTPPSVGVPGGGASTGGRGYQEGGAGGGGRVLDTTPPSVGVPVGGAPRGAGPGDYTTELREKKDISLEPVDDKDQEGTFDYREEERGLQRGGGGGGGGRQTSVEPIMSLKRTESDDSLVDYGEVEIQFNEDGSFIGEYTGTGTGTGGDNNKRNARDTRNDEMEMDYGGNMDLHSTMNAIYSMA